MRITQLMLAQGFGGAERSFVDLSLALAQAGHEVQAICHQDFVEREQVAGQPGVTLVGVRVRGWWDCLARRRIERAIEIFGPEVLQAHLARGAYLAGQIGRRLEIPVLVKTHNYVALKYYRNINLFVSTTRDQRDYLLREGVPAGAIVCVPNFSSLAPRAREWGDRPELTTYLSYGRMVKKKGFDVLLAAFRQVLDAGILARLVVAGEGPERAGLEELTDRLGLHGRVAFPGWLRDVAAELRQADVFVLPSLDEPFGVAVLEAMALDLPVIATRTKGPNEVLDADCSYLVPPGDIEALAHAMGEAARDYPGRQDKAGRALERFRTHYSREAVVPQYEALYRRLAGQR